MNSEVSILPGPVAAELSGAGSFFGACQIASSNFGAFLAEAETGIGETTEDAEIADAMPEENISIVELFLETIFKGDEDEELEGNKVLKRLKEILGEEAGAEAFKVIKDFFKDRKNLSEYFGSKQDISKFPEFAQLFEVLKGESPVEDLKALLEYCIKEMKKMMEGKPTAVLPASEELPEQEEAMQAEESSFVAKDAINLKMFIMAEKFEILQENRENFYWFIDDLLEKGLITFQDLDDTIAEFSGENAELELDFFWVTLKNLWDSVKNGDESKKEELIAMLRAVAEIKESAKELKETLQANPVSQEQPLRQAQQPQEEQPLQQQALPLRQVQRPQQELPLRQAQRPQQHQPVQENQPLRQVQQPQQVQPVQQAQENQLLRQAQQPQPVQQAQQHQPAQEEQPLRQAQQPQPVQEEQPLKQAQQPQPVQPIQQAQESQPLKQAQQAQQPAQPSQPEQQAQPAQPMQQPQPEVRAVWEGGGLKIEVVDAKTGEKLESVPAGSNMQERIHELEVIRQVVAKAKFITTPTGEQRLTIQLRPEHLGQLDLRVILNRGEMQIFAKVESATAQHALENNINFLREGLEKQGIHLDRLEVSIEQREKQDAWSLAQERREQKGHHNRQHKHGREARLAVSVNGDAKADTGRRLGYNTMEYLA